MPLVKITMAYAKWPIARQSPHGLARWGDYVFAINDDVDECDAWVVLEDLPRAESRRCPVDRTFFMGTEPPIHGKYNDRFLTQFATVVTCGGHAAGHPRHIHSFPPQPWFFGIDEDPSHSCALLPGFRYWTLEQIAALENGRNRSSLNLGGGAIALGRNGAEQGLGQAEFFELHQQTLQHRLS